jgi:ADP-ribose pyrophosphatase
MTDILFRTDDYVFSYRVAGVCVRNGRVLLQKQTNDPGHAFPGGHAELGETNAETLLREFREEIGAEISVGDLRWVGELFFPWDDKPCHQICLYYDIEITGGDIPQTGNFLAHEHIEGRNFDIEFHWVPLDRLGDIELYPPQASAFLTDGIGGVRHFIYRE